jgi:hypothetical protein
MCVESHFLGDSTTNKRGGFQRKYQMMQTLPKKLNGGNFIVFFKSDLLSTTSIKTNLCQAGVFMLKSSNHDVFKFFLRVMLNFGA